MGEFLNWLKFVGLTQIPYGCLRLFDAGGKHIALLGLNSALLSGRHREIREGKEVVNDDRYLILGEPQIHNLLLNEKFSNADLRIAVMHHPFDWLIEFDRELVRNSLMKACHFILHGHEHRPQVSIETGTGGDCIIIPAGASYNRREPEISRCANAYNYVHLNFATKKVKVYLQRYEDRQGWIKDTGTTGDGTPGFHEFTLPPKTKEPSLIVPTTAVEAPQAHDESLIVSTLKEWKTVHTEMQSLLDNLTTVVIWLNRCQIEPLKLEEHLYQAEQAWGTFGNCASKLRVIDSTFKSFQHIQKEPVVETVLGHTSKTARIGKQFAKDKPTLADARKLNRAIGAIKQDVEAALKVADKQVVALVDTLSRKSEWSKEGDNTWKSMTLLEDTTASLRRAIH
ncbi:MAG: metallophosphoesterase [Chloroflexi bacterium]|nr:metallophosphoesterase [Chloroflexota bacterium]